MYDQDYVDFDEFGIANIRCMCCGTPVITRTYVERTSIVDHSKKVQVMAMKRLSNHTEMAVRLSDGSLTGLPHCTDCAERPMDVAALHNLRIRAMTAELQWAGKEPQLIEAVMAPNRDTTVVMKLSDEADASPKE